MDKLRFFKALQKLNYYEGRNCLMGIALLNSQTDDQICSMAEFVGHRLLG
jgi:hypothetical protein